MSRQNDKKNKNTQHDNRNDNKNCANNEIAELRKEIEKLKTDMRTLKQELVVANHTNNILKKEVDRLDQYGRRHSVIIRGIPVPDEKESVEEESPIFDCGSGRGRKC